MSCTNPTSVYASSTPSPDAARQIDDDALLKREALRLVHGQRTTRDNRKLFANLPRAFPHAHLEQFIDWDLSWLQDSSQALDSTTFITLLNSEPRKCP